MAIGTVVAVKNTTVDTRIVAVTKALIAFLTVGTLLREYYTGAPFVCTVRVKYD